MDPAGAQSKNAKKKPTTGYVVSIYLTAGILIVGYIRLCTLEAEKRHHRKLRDKQMDKDREIEELKKENAMLASLYSTNEDDE
jgi:hypothetical protein